MDWTGWAIGLGLAGMAAELAGVTLAVLEIRDRGAKLSAYINARHSVTSSVRLGATGTIMASGRVTSATPQTLKEQVADIQHQLDQLPAQIEKSSRAAAGTALQEANEYTRTAAAGVTENLDRVAALLIGSLGGHRRALASVGLLVAGVGLQGAGGILGNLG